MTKINEDAIAQWRKDLLDTDFGLKFNADYSFITNAEGKWEGDASLFLAYRYADINDDAKLLAWYDDLSAKVLAEFGEEDITVSEYIVMMFTGIPLESARKLMWPQPLLDNDYDLATVTPQMFVQVLDVYMETGVVGWDIYIPTQAE